MSTYELRHGGVTDVGNVRPTNQDELLAEGELVAVADGMGGQGKGEIASRLAISALQETFWADPTEQGLVAAVSDANRAVRDHAEAHPSLQGMGTTIAAAALVSYEGRSNLVTVNVGDSRVYILRDSQLVRLSSDHSLVADLVRAGKLTDEDAQAHPQRHILTRVLGFVDDIEPHVCHTVPVRGDRLLLCSDGLFNELGEDEIADVLTTVTDAEDAAGQLVLAAKEHGGRDNITSVVLDLA